MIRKTRAQAVIIRDGRILMVRHHDLYIREDYWCLPGGSVEAGETPEQAVIRELKEEAGLDVRPVAWLGRQEFPGVQHGYAATETFLAEILHGEPRLGCDPEQIGWTEKFLREVRWMSLEGELLEQVDKLFFRENELAKNELTLTNLCIHT